MMTEIMLSKTAVMMYALAGFGTGHAIFAVLRVNPYTLMAAECFVGFAGVALLWQEGEISNLVIALVVAFIISGLILLGKDGKLAALREHPWWSIYFAIAIAAMTFGMWSRGYLYVRHHMTSVEYTGLLAMLPVYNLMFNLMLRNGENGTSLKEVAIAISCCVTLMIIMYLPDSSANVPASNHLSKTDSTAMNEHILERECSLVE